jgi:hypothetical protein
MRHFLAILLASIATAQAHAQAVAMKEYPPPGKLVDIGGRKLHLFCE